MSALTWPGNVQLGTSELRLAAVGDAAGLAALMAEPEVEQWWHQDWDEERWAECVAELLADPDNLPLILSDGGAVAGYVEVYRVSADVLGQHIEHGPTDLGMHLALAGSARGRGLGTALMRSVLGLATDILPGCQRLVAEPDALNAPSARAFANAGFAAAGTVHLPDKTALLVSAATEPPPTREQAMSATAATAPSTRTESGTPKEPSPAGDRQPPAARLPPATRPASCALLAKLLGALVSEEVLGAEPTGGQAEGSVREYRIDFERASYLFWARLGAFGAYSVRPDSVRRVGRGVLGDAETEPATDPSRFMIDAAADLGLTGTTTANYIAELSATLAADVRMAASDLPARELVRLPHAQIDAHLTGHPLLAANKGRLGFSASDCEQYAPEADRPLRPTWLAVSRELAEFRSVPSMSERDLVHHELDSATRQRFESVIRENGTDPAGYVFLPAHPWQVDHVVRQLWASSLLSGHIVVLGEAADEYRPTQSIRTLANTSDPGRFQTKLPLKILNTSVYRGIPPHCSLAAPLTTVWLRSLWDADPLLSSLTVLLGEIASVTVRHPHLSDVPGVPYQWDEMLGCIWREPVDPALGVGETVWPLALVLHEDRLGATAVAALAERAGCALSDWIAALVSVTVRPLLHLLHTYGVSVNPHGENLMVICDSKGMPSRLVIKDLVDDVCVSADPVPERSWEPDGPARVLPRKPWNVLRQYLVDALFLGVWAPLGDLLDNHGLPMASEELWALTRSAIVEYADSHPEQSDRLAATALLGPEFTRYPLNGYRLKLGYTDLDTRPPVPQAGTMPNPLYVPPANG